MSDSVRQPGQISSPSIVGSGTYDIRCRLQNGTTTGSFGAVGS
ncbi:hypothetical protein ACFVXC_05605 [Streptomyces sp. NPDC058257]